MTVDADGNPIYYIKLNEFSLSSDKYDIELVLLDKYSNRVEKRSLELSRSLNDNGIAVQIGNEALSMLSAHGYPVFSFSVSPNISDSSYAYISGGWNEAQAKIVAATNAISKSHTSAT
ncbi:MAG: hypothetical protein PHQ43_09680, partial [Dehalococcoidales bacterium]|nr:hypothetical protein [Dehalococcoidales bacterium]